MSIVELRIGSWSIPAEGKFISKGYSTNYFSSQLNELKCAQKETEFMTQRQTLKHLFLKECKINLIMLTVTVRNRDGSSSWLSAHFQPNCNLG